MSAKPGKNHRLVLEIQVTPRAPRDVLGPMHGGRLRVRITAPPVDGKANEHLIGFLARSFGVPRSRVRLTAGGRGRIKRVEIQAPVRIPPELERNPRDVHTEGR